MISIVIAAYNQHDTTYDCIQTIRETTQDCEIILIDNGSEPPLQAPFTGFIPVTIIRNEENKGFPAAVNQGIRAASGDIICLLNNDVAVTPGWAQRLINGLNEYDVVGPVTNYCAGMQCVKAEPYQTREGLFDSAHDWSDTYQDATEEVNFIIGFCMMFRRSMFDEIGDFDESLWPCSGEEIDWCFRAREAGKRIGIVLGCYVHHEGSLTFRDMQNAGQIEYDQVCKRNDEHLAERWGADFWMRHGMIPIVTDGIRLNLGCGPFPLKGFINVDQFYFVNPDLIADAVDLPYEPGSISEIYAGHLLEHFKYREGLRALKYWYSLLKPGGVIGITVPDYDFLVQEYASNPSPEALIEFNNQYIYSGIQPSPHQFAYSAALLEKVMAETGFINIKRMPVNHPYFPEPVPWQCGFMGVKP